MRSNKEEYSKGRHTTMLNCYTIEGKSYINHRLYGNLDSSADNQRLFQVKLIYADLDAVTEEAEISLAGSGRFNSNARLYQKQVHNNTDMNLPDDPHNPMT